MKWRMPWLLRISVLVFSVSTSSGFGELSITLGTIHLLPNTPGQAVDIYVTGGDDVQAVDLALMTANGGPELEPLDFIPPGTGVRGPRITNLDMTTGSIFAGNHLEPQITVGERGVYQVAFGSIITVSGAVRAEGLLARATLDTTGLFQGTYAFSLTALDFPTDFAGVPVSLTDGLLIVGAEVIPTVDAGPDQVVGGGDSVRLTGNHAGFGEGQVAYQWLQTNGPAVVLSDPHSASTIFIAPSGVSNTDLAFELTVSDSVNTRTDSVLVTVNADQSVFSINAGPDQSVGPNTFVDLNATVLNSGTRIVSVAWMQVSGPPVAFTGANTPNASFMAPGGITNTELVFEARAYDATHEAVDTVAVLVGANPANLLADAGYDQEVAAGAAVQLDGSASDTAGLAVTYFWNQLEGPAVQLSNDRVVNPTVTAPSLSTATQLKFQLTLRAGAMTSIDTVVLHVAAVAPNDQTGVTDQTGTTDQSDSTEDTTTQTPVQTQSLFPALNWTTSTAIAVGIGLLILAILFLWFFWL